MQYRSKHSLSMRPQLASAAGESHVLVPLPRPGETPTDGAELTSLHLALEHAGRKESFAPNDLGALDSCDRHRNEVVNGRQPNNQKAQLRSRAFHSTHYSLLTIHYSPSSARI
jgi:hypothetical protein